MNMIEVNKTTAEGKFRYININGFKDEAEHELVFQRVRQLIESMQGRIKVF